MASYPNSSVALPVPPGASGAEILLTRAHYTKCFRSPGFPVGVALIASFLESQGVSVRVLDLAVQKNWRTALKDEMERNAPKVVGISLQITQYEEAIQIARFVKSNYPETKVVFGGSFPSSAPEECLNNPEIDVVCCSEGEWTMLHLIQTWERGSELGTIDGIAFRGKDGSIIQTPRRELIENLDQMPLAAYHLLDLEPYINADHTSDFTNRKNRCMELITSRGCPYHCIFCHSFFGKKFRGRSPQHVVDEILLLHNKYKVSEFVIWDDTFTMDIQRAKDICDLIIQSGIKITIQLRGGVRVEQMDEELMAKLKEAGVETMCVGIESAVWRIQKMIKKNLKIEKVDRLLSLASKYKITTIGLMMMGFPGEKIAEIKENIRWASNSLLDYTFFSIVTPFPSTELYDIAVREGYYQKNKDYKRMNVMTPHMEIPELPSGLIKWLQMQAYLRFYLKPRRLRKLFTSAYRIKTFIGSIFDYIGIAFTYYGRKLRNQTN